MQVASCDARPRTREESNPRPAREQAREPRDNSRGPVRTTKVAKNLEFMHLDHADPRRGLRGHHRNRKKPRVFAPRPRRSPQRVARAPQKSQKTSSFCTSTTPIPADGRASMLEIAKNIGFCTSTTPIPAEGRASSAEIAKNHRFLHLGHADPRRGSREHRRNRKKNHGFLHLDHADPRRGSRGNFRNHKKPWVPAEGRFSCSVVGTTPPP